MLQRNRFVNTTEKKLERQVQVWALIGPFLMMLALLLITFKAPSDHLNLPLAALLGLGLCWKWKLKGLAVSIGLLAAVIVYQYAGIPVEERLWLIGIALAISLAFVVTALSFEEIETIIKSMEVESNSRLDNLLQLDEKLKAAQVSYQSEAKQWALKSDAHQLENADIKAKLDSYEKLLSIVREELMETHAQHEKLLEELFQKKHETALMQERLDGAQNEIKDLSAMHFEKSYDDQDKKEEQRAKYNHDIALLQSQLEEALFSNSGAVKQADEYKKELAATKELLESSNNISQIAHDEQLLQQAVVQEMSDHIETLNREKALLNASLEKLQKEFESLRNQDQQKAILIEETRSKLAMATQQLAHWQERMMHFNSLSEKLENNLAKNQLLENEKNALQKKLEELSHERDSLSKLVEERASALQNSIPAQTTEIDSTQRRFEGMYIQLKGQFQEKSEVLDDTRRELFHTKEMLQVLQKELEESSKFDRSEWDAAIERHIQQIEKEYLQEKITLLEEIESMQEIISTLLQNPKKRPITNTQSYNATSGTLSFIA